MAIVVSKLTTGVNSHLTTAEEANGMYTDFVSEGFIGTLSNTSGVAPATGAFAANAQGTPDTTIALSAGVAYATGTPTSQNSQTFRIKNSASTNLTTSSNSSGSTKYDWIYISLDATKLNAPNTAGDDVATIVASRSSSASADDGTPPTYGVVIAVVTVANGFTTITNGNIRDARVSSVVTATSNGTSQDWFSTGAVPSSVTNNGNRSYDLLFTGTNLTSYLSNGMRLKCTRTVTAPTQCTSLNGTTQYWSRVRASLTGTLSTITDDVSFLVWLKPGAYQQGTIFSMYNGTSGLICRLSAAGQLEFYGFNGGAANFRGWTTYQSVSLNKGGWLSGSLDMSGNTTATNKAMFDGADVPLTLGAGGTSPSSFINLGDLQVGASNGAVFYSGKVAQLSIFSGNVSTITQATMRGYANQAMTGAETNCIFHVSFNNSTTDLSSSANSLITSAGSPTATNADSPFGIQADGTTAGTTEYAIITKTAFSTNTTLTVQVPEGCALPTSGGISAVSYSTQKSPYGFPGQSNRWAVISLHKTQSSQASAVVSTYYNVGSIQLTCPVGEWNLGYKEAFLQSGSVAGAVSGKTTLSTSSSAETDTLFAGYCNGANVLQAASTVTVTRPVSLSSATLYYLISTPIQNTGGGTIGLFSIGDQAPAYVEATPSYL